VLDAFAHQDIPFERIVEELQIERDASRPTLYQVMFNHQRTSEARLAFDDLQLAAMSAPETGSKFDLTLYATEGPEQIALRMVYNSDIFDGATVAVMLARFVVLLEAIVNDPGCQVSSLPLLTGVERAPRHAPAMSLTYPPAFTRFDSDALSSTIPARFERQVAAYPEHIAVKTPRHVWTYRQLDAEAATIAGKIEALAGGADTRVGLLFESGAPLMAAIFGTLKAGQTYVPLDPSNPRDRLAYMLKHSQASVLLTDAAHLALARELAGDSVAVVNSEEADVDAPFSRLRRPSPDSVAYILYTSGSTGVPKGVVQSHRNVLHFMRVYTNNLGIHPGDRLSLLSSYGFDGAVMDIFGALLNGATLVPANLLSDGLEGALGRIGEGRVTVFHSTPTVFRQLFGSGSANGELQHVRTVVLGGEEALRSDLELFKARFPREAVFVNGLGPSESTVTLQHFMDHDTINTRASLPVGLPVENTEVLLLDQSGAATAVYGEIGIRSPHVALGYWRDEEKTAAAFTSDPDDAGRRVYRTGDIGRRLPDGTLEFVGRKDTQVKIRGFRIELGEVEAVLGEHPAVQECAVLARADDGGAARLVAYVRPSTSQPNLATELKTFLKEKLPAYMVPAAFVVLDELPLTPNGKVDRRALPEPGQAWRGTRAWTDAGSTSSRPGTSVEVAIARIWTGVLGTNEVNLDDKFFDLGGHSLTALQVISMLKRELGCQVRFNDLVYQTLRQLAAACEKQLADAVR
jgi:amino acid adenylation domain-containing protein